LNNSEEFDSLLLFLEESVTLSRDKNKPDFSHQQSTPQKLLSPDFGLILAYLILDQIQIDIFLKLKPLLAKFRIRDKHVFFQKGAF